MQKQLEERAIAAAGCRTTPTASSARSATRSSGAVDQQVMPVINQVGKELGYTLIFRKFESGLIYADEAIDITKSVIQRLDATAGK